MWHCNYISPEFLPYNSKQVSIAGTQDLNFTKWKLYLPQACCNWSESLWIRVYSRGSSYWFKDGMKLSVKIRTSTKRDTDQIESTLITWVSALYINGNINFLPVHIHCLVYFIYCVLKGQERYSKVWLCFILVSCMTLLNSITDSVGIVSFNVM